MLADIRSTVKDKHLTFLTNAIGSHICGFTGKALKASRDRRAKPLVNMLD